MCFGYNSHDGGGVRNSNALVLRGVPLVLEGGVNGIGERPVFAFLSLG